MVIITKNRSSIFYLTFTFAAEVSILAAAREDQLNANRN